MVGSYIKKQLPWSAKAKALLIHISLIVAEQNVCFNISKPYLFNYLLISIHPAYSDCHTRNAFINLSSGITGAVSHEIQLSLVPGKVFFYLTKAESILNLCLG